MNSRNKVKRKKNQLLSLLKRKKNKKSKMRRILILMRNKLRSMKVRRLNNLLKKLKRNKKILSLRKSNLKYQISINVSIVRERGNAMYARVLADLLRIHLSSN